MSEALVMRLRCTSRCHRCLARLGATTGVAGITTRLGQRLTVRDILHELCRAADDAGRVEGASLMLARRLRLASSRVLSILAKLRKAGIVGLEGAVPHP